MVANKQKATKRKVPVSEEVEKPKANNGKQHVKVTDTADDESASDYYESDEVRFIQIYL